MCAERSARQNYTTWQSFAPVWVLAVGLRRTEILHKSWVNSRPLHAKVFDDPVYFNHDGVSGMQPGILAKLDTLRLPEKPAKETADPGD